LVDIGVDGSYYDGY